MISKKNTYGKIGMFNHFHKYLGIFTHRILPSAPSAALLSQGIHHDVSSKAPPHGEDLPEKGDSNGKTMENTT